MSKNYRSMIEKMHECQLSRLTEISIEDGRLCFGNAPPTKKRGLYWLYTSYSNDEFLSSTNHPKKGSVPFKELIEQHSQFNNVCSISVCGYRLVYNGVTVDLRDRIRQEINGGASPGPLAIRLSSLNDLSKWRVSFVLWTDIDFDSPHEYRKYSKVIERLWRIHYGWPILCRS